ncbi:MAG TPA: SCO family protein [Ktedonobacterales bacterium]
MRLRNISRVIVIALVVVVSAVALLHERFAQSAAPTLVGGDVLNAATPSFRLHDQSGALVDMKSLRGHPVVVTFLDMTCTQECPLQAHMLQQAGNFLGAKQANQVDWLVVSVNPNNTPADANAFMQKNNVKLPIKVLLGSQAELKPVWASYYIDVQPTPTDVNHTVALFLIDKSGRERMVFLGSFDPKAVSTDLATLLKQ